MTVLDDGADSCPATQILEIERLPELDHAPDPQAGDYQWLLFSSSLSPTSSVLYTPDLTSAELILGDQFNSHPSSTDQHGSIEIPLEGEGGGADTKTRRLDKYGRLHWVQGPRMSSVAELNDHWSLPIWSARLFIQTTQSISHYGTG